MRVYTVYVIVIFSGAMIYTVYTLGRIDMKETTLWTAISILAAAIVLLVLVSLGLV